MRTVKMSQNPQYALNQLLATNPQLQQAMQFIKQNGGNGEQAFYTLAKQYGVSPNDFLNMLNS